MEDYKKDDESFVVSCYRRLPILVDRADKNFIYDEDGKKYLDLFTGLGVNIIGHNHPVLQKTIQEQASKFLHISNHFLNKPAISLAKKMIELTFDGKVYFANSGTEAAETLIKYIHKWTKFKGKENRGIIVLKGSYHGRTLGSLHITRQAGVYQDYPVSTLPVYEVEMNDLSQVKRIIEEFQPSAFLAEPVQGSGGVYLVDSTYLKDVENLCKENDMLFCLDEIQTGFGRTGTFFCYQQYELTPDILLFGKSVGGGLPLAGMIVQREISHLFQLGDHGATFAPSSLAASLGLGLIEVLENENLLTKGLLSSKLLETSLLEIKEQYPLIIKEVRSKGMMFGLSLSLAKQDAIKMQDTLLEKGFLIDLTQGNILRLLPPLTLQAEEIKDFLTAFEETIKEKQNELQPQLI